MMRVLSVVLSVILVGCVFGAPQFDFPVPSYVAGGVVWPQPAKYTTQPGNYSMSPQAFGFVATGATNKILQDAFDRYMQYIFLTSDAVGAEGAFPLLGLAVNVAQATPSDRITYLTDESYSLVINSSGATLTANNVFGALRGLETFSQLVIRMGNVYSINFATIQDQPRYTWRGFLIDTGRHFLSVETIKKTIRAMSYDKLNVLHWHIYDGQSFPIESKKFPLLTQMGPYHPSEVYSQADLRDLVQYANSFGVRLLPEFDMPGHASSWGFAYPWLVMNCTKQSDPYDFNDYWADQPLDPTNDLTYDFIDAFFAEMTTIFPDEFYHLGGDEVNFECWQIPRIEQWMKNNNISDYPALQGYFINRVYPIITKYGKQVLYWEEVFENTSPSKTGVIIDVWKSFTEIDPVVQAGFKAILSHGWYLDDWGVCPPTEWSDYYQVDPTPANLPPAQASLIIGGSISSWGETVDDANWDSRSYPRTSAAAESLWTPKALTNVTTAYPRILTHRCHLFQRGIRSTPIGPGPGCH